MLWMRSAISFVIGGLLGEFCDFVGNHGESKAMLTGASRFDGGLRASKFVCSARSSMTSMICRCHRAMRGVDYFRGRLDRLVGAVEASVPSPWSESGDNFRESGWRYRARPYGIGDG